MPRVVQIVVRQLRRAVPLDRELQLLRRHADAVIDHGDERAAALLQGDRDATGTGVDGILDQLLHGAGGPLDHFTRGDAVDEGRGQAAQGRRGRNDCRHDGGWRAHGGRVYDFRLWEGYWRPSTLSPSTAGWSKSSTPPRELGRYRSPARPTGLPTTAVTMASSRSNRLATRRTSSAVTAPISPARLSR
jgi:hypothetical protein